MKYSLTATIGAAALIAALLVLGVSVAGNLLIPAEKASPSGTVASAPAPPAPAETKPAAPPAAAETKPADPPAETLKAVKPSPPVKTADTAEGAKVFNKCKACHSATKDGKNKFGPKLWGVVERAKASVGGYKYSAALSGLGGKWSAADLDAFLKAPKKFAPGTKMPFAGLKKAAERAAVIAFLRRPAGQPKP